MEITLLQIFVVASIVTCLFLFFNEILDILSGISVIVIIFILLIIYAIKESVSTFINKIKRR